MIGRGELFLNFRVEKLLSYVAITRATGFRLSFIPKYTNRKSLEKAYLRLMPIFIAGIGFI